MLGKCRLFSSLLFYDFFRGLFFFNLQLFFFLVGCLVFFFLFWENELFMVGELVGGLFSRMLMLFFVFKRKIFFLRNGKFLGFLVKV